jgi:CubicO group peptidase (beta-lactamase class C family)
MFRSKPGLAIASALLIFCARSKSQAGEELSAARAQEPAVSRASAERIVALLQDHVARKQIAGAVVLVAQHGRLLLLQAVGKQDVEAGVAMTPDSIFRIASMTKPVTSVAVMMLADAGKLDLSDPIARFLPEFKFMNVAVPKKKDGGKERPSNSLSDYDLVSAYRPITVRDLLTHTAGLSYRMDDRPLLGELYSKAEICDGISPCDHSLAENVRRLAEQPLLHQPGTAFEYGLNTDVLGRLVEIISGMSLDAFFTERIFKPLKMNDTHFLLPDSKRGRLAALYEPGEDGAIVRAGEGPTVKGRLIYSASMPYSNTKAYFSGGAGLVSTAGDYARFLQMLLNRGELEGARVLQPETASAMTRVQTGSLPLWIAARGQSFGYGFRVTIASAPDSKKDFVGTFSFGGMYYTDAWADPQHGVVGILLSQIYPSRHLKLRDEFHRLMNESLQP